MRCWAPAVVVLSIGWFAFALTVPALTMRETVPIDAISAPLLSVHVLAGAWCAVGQAPACAVFVGTQYGLDYWTIWSPAMGAVRLRYYYEALFWCMGVLTTVLVLVLFFTAVRSAMQRREPPAPAGIPVVAQVSVTEGVGLERL